MCNERDFKLKLARRDKEGPFIFLKRGIHQEDTPVLNISIPNMNALNFIKEILLDSQINFITVIVEDFNILLPPINRTSGQKLRRETLELNNIISQIDPIDTYRTVHLNT